jgi:hypothetical protein
MDFRSFRPVVRSTPLPCKLAQALRHDWAGGRRLVIENEVVCSAPNAGGQQMPYRRPSPPLKFWITP